MFPYINIFSLQIPTYGLIAVAGALVAALFVVRENRRSSPPLIAEPDLLNMVAVLAVGVLVGAKVLYMITIIPSLVRNWHLLAGDWSQLLGLLTSGGVFYGGLFGGIGAIIIYCRKYAIPLQNAATLFTCAIPLFHIFGRLGCFCAGCCYGIASDWGIAFSHSLHAPNGLSLLPVQLIESGFNLVLFGVLFYLLRHLSKGWLIFPIYLCSYAVMRFVLEFFRGDTIRGVWLLSTSQWISLALLVALGLWFVRYKKRLAAESAQT